MLLVSRVLVGAPRAESKYSTSVQSPGAVFKCRVHTNPDRRCTELDMGRGRQLRCLARGDTGETKKTKPYPKWLAILLTASKRPQDTERDLSASPDRFWALVVKVSYSLQHYKIASHLGLVFSQWPCSLSLSSKQPDKGGFFPAYPKLLSFLHLLPCGFAACRWVCEWLGALLPAPGSAEIGVHGMTPGGAVVGPWCVVLLATWRSVGSLTVQQIIPGVCFLC